MYLVHSTHWSPLSIYKLPICVVQVIKHHKLISSMFIGTNIENMSAGS